MNCTRHRAGDPYCRYSTPFDDPPFDDPPFDDPPFDDPPFDDPPFDDPPFDDPPGTPTAGDSGGGEGEGGGDTDELEFEYQQRAGRYARHSSHDHLQRTVISLSAVVWCNVMACLLPYLARLNRPLHAPYYSMLHTTPRSLLHASYSTLLTPCFLLHAPYSTLPYSVRPTLHAP
jgi:hypothetical protein